MADNFERRIRRDDDQNEGNRQIGQGYYGTKGMGQHGSHRNGDDDRDYNYDTGPNRPIRRREMMTCMIVATPILKARRGPKGYQRSDERIHEEACEILTQHGNLELSVQNGEITLTGTVMDRRMKRMAEDVLESISGVKDIHNQIRVQQQGSSQTGMSPMGSENA